MKPVLAVLLLSSPLLGALAAPAAPLSAPAGAGAQEHEADADVQQWVVTSDGERIATRGPWRVEGRRVLFVAANGSLVSIRADQVDLEASREASAPREEGDDDATPDKPLPSSPEEKPPPRLVLTQEDLPPMSAAEQRAPAADAGAAGGESAAAGASPKVPGLVIVEWRRVGGDDQPVQIFGTVRNDGARAVSSASVVVKLFDEAGNEIGSQPAELQAPSLQKNQSTGFRASFPEVFQFERAEIVPTG